MPVVDELRVDYRLIIGLPRRGPLKSGAGHVFGVHFVRRYYMLLYAVICYYMLLYAIICCYMLSYVIICYHMLL